MDPVTTTAARALAAGDVLGALNYVALRNDAPALALRGIAMAQLGELDRAKTLLRKAARSFGPKEALARARCVVAEEEVALVQRDLGRPAKTLDLARATLEAHGDRLNAAHARHLAIRRLLLTGRLDEAEEAVGGVDTAPLSPALTAAHELIVAGVDVRRLRMAAARAALARARRAAREAAIPVLTAEVESAMRALDTPAARLVGQGLERLVKLDEVEALSATDALIVDECRYAVRGAGTSVSLAGRPVLFALALTLGAGWPEDVSREALIRNAFRSKHADESHRGRLRVEIGRLRAALRALASVSATKRGFVLVPRVAEAVVVLARPFAEEHATVLALLHDGEAWSSSALAVALGTSQRTVQRALESLAADGKVRSYGRGRAHRWTSPPLPGITPVLLLPGPLPGD